MAVPTLLQLIEEQNSRRAVVRIVIGGAELPIWSSVTYEFAFGEGPTATITVPSRQFLPAAVAEEASVQIWFGFKSGVTVLEAPVFLDAVVDSVGNNGPEIVIECVMDGPRKMLYSYNRRIDYDFTAVIAQDTVIDLLALAGVTNYYVDLDPWVIGTAVPQTIEFSTYGEAINKISEVDGSPWYALPTGQVRVEKRDPLPSPSARRTYFTGVLTGDVSTNPTAITNDAAQPRISDLSRNKFRAEVANFIEVDGAVLVTLGPNGEQNSEQIFETVDGASGQFPNGAYWIPTPPLFQDFTFSNELVDTNAKAFEVAERYFLLKNRLPEKIPLTIPGDSDVFLGETVRIVDPRYSGVSSLYFVQGYRTTVDANTCTTELDLIGGPESGTTGYAAPFAEFIWKYSALHHLIGGDITRYTDLGPGSDPGSKLCEDLPEWDQFSTDIVDTSITIDQRVVIIGLDGTPSADFDGYITNWAWEWVDSLDFHHHLTGSRVTIVVNPDASSSIEVTLVVTDDSGRTGTITKTVYTSADYLGAPGGHDETENDTHHGGGVVGGDCSGPKPCPECPDGVTPGQPPDGDFPNPYGNNPPPGACGGMTTQFYVAAHAYAMGSVDNRTWHDLTPTDVGASGNFISVASGILYSTQKSYAIFGTDAGEVVVTTDICVSGTLTQTMSGSIECIEIDKTTLGDPAEGSNFGDENTDSTPTDGTIPIYTQGNPGTLTIMQAYQQCLAVGFPSTNAVIAVAVMMAESGLYSAATNSAGNNPPSTDRGICQFNSHFHSEVSNTCAYNTECAITNFYRVSSGGTDFSQWAAFNAGSYKQYLSQVQEATGVVGDIGDTKHGTNIKSIVSFKAWLGTSEGEVWVSQNSGRSWSLVGKPNSFPVYAILTDTRVFSTLVVGGDSSNPDSLISIYDDSINQFVSIPIRGDMYDYLLSNPGVHAIDVRLNDTALAILLSDNTIWFNYDPSNEFDGWYITNGTAGIINSIAPGFDGELVAAGEASYLTVDNENFV